MTQSVSSPLSSKPPSLFPSHKHSTHCLLLQPASCLQNTPPPPRPCWAATALPLHAGPLQPCPSMQGRPCWVASALPLQAGHVAAHAALPSPLGHAAFPAWRPPTRHLEGQDQRSHMCECVPIIWPAGQRSTLSYVTLCAWGRVAWGVDFLQAMCGWVGACVWLGAHACVSVTGCSYMRVCGWMLIHACVWLDAHARVCVAGCSCMCV